MTNLIKICFLTLLLSFGWGKSQNYFWLQNESTGKEVKVLLHSTVKYTLYSDTTLKVGDLSMEHYTIKWRADSFLYDHKIHLETDKIISYTDTSFILKKGEEIIFDDIQLFYAYHPAQVRLRKTAIWLSVLSTPFFLEGATKGLLEGFERKNASYVPIRLLGAGAIMTLGLTPLLIPPKGYEIGEGKWRFRFDS